ncbi:ABC transporter permease [Candidatus Micrarchaeota archaeon]|nr:ABC transporter permease [Candidatus Micrarchaeota archaeon]
MNNELTAVYFIWKRELIRFFRSKSRVIGSLGMPFFLLAVLGSGLNNVMEVSGGNYMDFITPGIIAMVLLFGSLLSGITVIMDRQFGFLKETLVAPVSRLSIVVGKSLGGATTAIIQGILILGIAMAMGVAVDLTSIPVLLILMLLVSLSFVTLGVALASLMEDMHGFQLVMNFIVMPMFFLSGALFPIDTAPEIVRYISYIDPLTYAVEGMRYLLLDYSYLPLSIVFGVLGGFFIITTSLAVYLFNGIES